VEAATIKLKQRKHRPNLLRIAAPHRFSQLLHGCRGRRAACGFRRNDAVQNRTRDLQDHDRRDGFGARSEALIAVPFEQSGFRPRDRALHGSGYGHEFILGARAYRERISRSFGHQKSVSDCDAPANLDLLDVAPVSTLENKSWRMPLLSGAVADQLHKPPATNKQRQDTRCK
jgi:hypothetical protein